MSNKPKNLILESLECIELPNDSGGKYYTRLIVDKLEENSYTQLLSKCELDTEYIIDRAFIIKRRVRIHLVVGQYVEIAIAQKDDNFIDIKNINKTLDFDVFDIVTDIPIHENQANEFNTRSIEINQKDKRPHFRDFKDVTMKKPEDNIPLNPLNELKEEKYYTFVQRADLGEFIINLGCLDEIEKATIVGARPDTYYRHVFKQNGFEFELKFDFSDLPTYSYEDVTDGELRALVEEFTFSDIEPVWKKLAKEDILDQLCERINKPEKINQSKSSMCGAAAVIYELAKRSPKRYISICRELYELGYFVRPNDLYSASDKLKNSPKKDNLDEIDWMILATITEHTNPYTSEIDCNSTNNQLRSDYHQVKKYLMDLLECNDTLFAESTTIPSDMENIILAETSYGLGQPVILSINQDLITSKNDWDFYPNHWVSYRGGLSFYPHFLKGLCVKFKVYSWGKIIWVDVSFIEFMIYFYAALIGINPHDD